MNWMTSIATEAEAEETWNSDVSRAHLERLSRLALENAINQRDFDFESEIGREVKAIEAAGFVVSYGGKMFSKEEFMEWCREKVLAFPEYRIDVVNTFSSIDMHTGTATIFLNTRVVENVDAAIEGCSLLDWRRTKSGKSTKWVCTKHTIMRGFAGGFDFDG